MTVVFRPELVAYALHRGYTPEQIEIVRTRASDWYAGADWGAPVYAIIHLFAATLSLVEQDRLGTLPKRRIRPPVVLPAPRPRPPEKKAVKAGFFS